MIMTSAFDAWFLENNTFKIESAHKSNAQLFEKTKYDVGTNIVW